MSVIEKETGILLAKANELEGSLRKISSLLAPSKRGDFELEPRRKLERWRDEVHSLTEVLVHAPLLIFVGEKNAGKTTLLNSLLIEELHQPSGDELENGTEKSCWIIPRSIVRNRNIQSDDHQKVIDCPDKEIFSNKLAKPCALLDTPGSNELKQIRRQIANDSFCKNPNRILIFVAKEHCEWRKDFETIVKQIESNVIVPVLTRIEGRTADEEQKDSLNFLDKLKEKAPNCEVLDTVIINHFENPIDEQRKQEQLDEFRKKVNEALGKVGSGGLGHEADVVKSLQDSYGKFLEEEFKKSFRENLSCCEAELDNRKEKESKIPKHLTEAMEGKSKEVETLADGLLRMETSAQIPHILFGFKEILSVSVWAWSSISRLPLAFSGSYVSIAKSTWNAVKDTRYRNKTLAWINRRFFGEAKRRIRELANGKELREAILKDFEKLDPSIKPKQISKAIPDKDIQLADDRAFEDLGQEAKEVLGKLVDEKIDARKRRFRVFGFIGFLLFWIFFIWPFFSLYADYMRPSFENLKSFLGLSQSFQSLKDFPSGAFSIFLTAFILSVVPTLIYIRLLLPLLLKGLARKIRNEFEQKLAEMIKKTQEKGMLEIRWENPYVEALKNLLSK